MLWKEMQSKPYGGFFLKMRYNKKRIQFFQEQIELLKIEKIK
ncbi:hypothetical protein DB44_FO00020 [Candidatus Protochlamydia amoebophila]|uniref:Uncharacterized protein n=1 Tax=Candidatus Protochlamydia amoebophila TaxID=362787 RepID=A0A0C1GZ07_9BACT|nr:hypothetical protein DB44_FO00020 [Candidatus Protochlamydia amoebophila]